MTFTHEQCIAGLGRLAEAVIEFPAEVPVTAALTPRELEVFAEGIKYGARALENVRCSW